MSWGVHGGSKTMNFVSTATSRGFSTRWMQRRSFPDYFSVFPMHNRAAAWAVQTYKKSLDMRLLGRASIATRAKPIVSCSQILSTLTTNTTNAAP